MVTDNKQRAKFNLTYGVRDATTADAALNLVEGYRLKAAHTWGIDVTVKSKGLALLQIYVNGEEIVDSPLFIKIDTGKCADELRVPDELGVCKCNPSTTSVNGRCVRLSLLIPVIVVPAVVLIAAGVLAYLQYLLSKRDAVWTVKRAELLLDDPAEVLGRGTFGMVVKAEYRGTSVAVKRVIPPRKGTSRESIFDVQSSNKGNSFKASVAGSYHSGEGKIEEEEGEVAPDELALNVQDARAGMAEPSSAGLASHGGTFSISSRSQTSEPWWKTLWYGDELSRLRADFVEEMRMLSKLRHPCITTVMGAVIDKNTEPMMVMEMMEYGSLYDLLHNDSIEIDGDLVLPILRDIAQGLRFLHAAEPLIVHGDLKSHNVLVDAKFRAKVADFGLSQKKALGISTQLGMSRAAPSGTPYWMAPELLNGHYNTTASDVYAFAVVLFEVYSRQEPYLGEQTDEVLKDVANVARREPKRPGIPRSCPEGAAQLMQDCWHTQPELRPPFDEIERRLKALTSASANPLSQISAQGCGPARRAAMTKTEDMLYDVFPRHIADALKQGRTVEPERRECVTIFFSDIVGFTVISGTLDPEKVSMMLHRLYTAFDALSREFEVFKVETIGDAYMAVTNLVQDQENDHAVRIAQFAIGAIKAAQATPIDLDDPSKGCVRIRVGFHSGPVVANVVGTRNLRYCLFGDTVNTASRMESNSEELKIHVSQRAAEILRKQLGALAPAARRRIRVKARGVIQVKGKGEMKTYWVSESSSSSNSNPRHSSGSFDRHQLNTVSEDVNSEERQTATEVDAGIGPVETLYTVSEVDAAAGFSLSFARSLSLSRARALSLSLARSLALSLSLCRRRRR
jgi:serine/threonine protein kinase/class 3 adenylate cyclase